jgi:hypothetical protein
MFTVEYSRFGPWILEIKGEDTLPKLFEPYIDSKRNAQLSYKFPRQIERRVANPDMELYDYVINLYDNELLVLERKDKEVNSVNLSLDEIEGITLKENLLKGTFQLFTKEKVFSVPFNTVSLELMQNMVQSIIDKRNLRENPKPVIGDEDLQKDLSYFYQQSLLKELKLNPKLQIIAHQQTVRLATYKESGFKRFLHGLFQRELLESMYLSDGKELRIITRDKNFNRGNRPVYSKTTHYLLLNNIKDHSWLKEQRDPVLLRLKLWLSHEELGFCLYGANQGIPRLEPLLERQRD